MNSAKRIGRAIPDDGSRVCPMVETSGSDDLRGTRKHENSRTVSKTADRFFGQLLALADPDRLGVGPPDADTQVSLPLQHVKGPSHSFMGPESLLPDPPDSLRSTRVFILLPSPFTLAVELAE